MAPKNPKTAFFSTKSKEVMSRLGLDPERLKRENTSEVMIPKMAIVGFLDTIEQFAKIGKQTVSSSVQGLNLTQMKLFLGAIRGTLDMIDQSLLAYEASLRQVKVKDMVDIIAKSVRSDTETPEEDEENETDEGDDEEHQDSLQEEEEEEPEEDDETDDSSDDDAFSSPKKQNAPSTNATYDLPRNPTSVSPVA